MIHSNPYLYIQTTNSPLYNEKIYESASFSMTVTKAMKLILLKNSKRSFRPQFDTSGNRLFRPTRFLEIRENRPSDGNTAPMAD